MLRVEQAPDWLAGYFGDHVVVAVDVEYLGLAPYGRGRGHPVVIVPHEAR